MIMDTLQPAERFQAPFAACRLVTQYIHIAIVGTNFKEGIVWAVPLIEHLLDQIVTLAELKPHRPLVRLPTGITLYSEDHPFGLPVVPFPAPLL